MTVTSAKLLPEKNVAGTSSRRGTRLPENLVLIRRITKLLREYTEEEVEKLTREYSAAPHPVKYRPRGRTAHREAHKDISPH